MLGLSSYKVTVKKPQQELRTDGWGDQTYYNVWEDVYVLAPDKRSAAHQAKLFVGYPPTMAASMSGTRDITVLETF